MFFFVEKLANVRVCNFEDTVKDICNFEGTDTASPFYSMCRAVPSMWGHFGHSTYAKTLHTNGIFCHMAFSIIHKIPIEHYFLTKIFAFVVDLPYLCKKFGNISIF